MAKEKPKEKQPSYLPPPPMGKTKRETLKNWARFVGHYSKRGAKELLREAKTYSKQPRKRRRRKKAKRRR